MIKSNLTCRKHDILYLYAYAVVLFLVALYCILQNIVQVAQENCPIQSFRSLQLSLLNVLSQLFVIINLLDQV